MFLAPKVGGSLTFGPTSSAGGGGPSGLKPGGSNAEMSEVSILSKRDEIPSLGSSFGFSDEASGGGGPSGLNPGGKNEPISSKSNLSKSCKVRIWVLAQGLLEICSIQNILS